MKARYFFFPPPPLEFLFCFIVFCFSPNSPPNRRQTTVAISKVTNCSLSHLEPVTSSGDAFCTEPACCMPPPPPFIFLSTTEICVECKRCVACGTLQTVQQNDSDSPRTHNLPRPLPNLHCLDTLRLRSGERNARACMKPHRKRLHEINKALLDEMDDASRRLQPLRPGVATSGSPIRHVPSNHKTLPTPSKTSHRCLSPP